MIYLKIKFIIDLYSDICKQMETGERKMFGSFACLFVCLRSSFVCKSVLYISFHFFFVRSFHLSTLKTCTACLRLAALMTYTHFTFAFELFASFDLGPWVCSFSLFLFSLHFHLLLRMYFRISQCLCGMLFKPLNFLSLLKFMFVSLLPQMHSASFFQFE